MEQQGSPPCTPTVTRRDTSSPEPPVTPPRSNVTAASTTETSSFSPTTPTPASTASCNPLSISEPTLRFPRPLGSRHLANWISSSNPDIMRVTSTEDTGLSESTYELISGTDTESQDENYNESMSESVGSLDFHRPDDVHSIADTERTFDDESVADGLEPRAQLSPENEDGDRAAKLLEQSQMHAETSLNNDDADPESEDDARSRSSLEYTQQSLKTPSIPTPEASKIVDRSTEVVESWLEAGSDDESDSDENSGVSLKSTIKDWQKYIWGSRAHGWHFLRQVGFDIPPGIFLLIALLIPAFFSSPPSDPHSPAATSVLTIHSTATTLPTSQTSSTSWALSTATGTAELVPLEDIKPDEWLFGGKKPDLAVFKQQNANYLVRIPSDVKRTWLSKRCLMFSATRGVDTVPIDVSSADDQGVIIKFPQKETYGTVQVEITALCRPKVRQVFRITFEKSIVGGALERTKHLAQDLTDLVPAAAQEAERRLGEAKRSLESASDNVLTASDSLFKDISVRFHNAHRSLGYIKVNARTRIHDTAEKISDKVESIADGVSQRLLTAKDVQDQAQLNLLDAQIAAKLWWLKVTGSKNEHDRYEDKAREFMAEKKANAIEAYKARHPDNNSAIKGRAQLLNILFRGSRCGTKADRGKRATQQCNRVA